MVGVGFCFWFQSSDFAESGLGQGRRSECCRSAIGVGRSVSKYAVRIKRSTVGSRETLEIDDL